jgi:hypothetical protein
LANFFNGHFFCQKENSKFKNLKTKQFKFWNFQSFGTQKKKKKEKEKSPDFYT